MRYILVLGLSLIQIIAFSGISCAENRTALVIGNGTYASYKPLPNPVNDANDMADLLTDLGFDVIREINADRRTMVDAINRFGNKLFKSEVGIFYFAGHGMQIRKINYLIPVNTAMASEADAEYECVYVKRVLDKMKESGTCLNIIILDACRNNPLQKQLQSTAPSRDIARKEMPPGLAQMSAPPGSIIAYATSEGATASDGRGRNGVYTSALLKNLKNPSFTVQQVLNTTGLDVMERTSEQQIPWTSSTPIPPFYLASGSTVVEDSTKLNVGVSGHGVFEWYATISGGLSMDGSGDNSPTAKALAKVITDPSLKLNSLARSVRNMVLTETNGYQVTAWEDLIIGEDISLAEDIGRIKISIVIANANYTQVPSLENPINDGKLIGKKLEDIGFEVTYLFDSDRIETEKEFSKIIKRLGKLKKEYVFVLYYVGHGIEVSGDSYLIPVDARIDDVDDVKFEAFSFRRIKKMLGSFSNRGYQVYFLDTDRNNPFATNFR